MKLIKEDVKNHIKAIIELNTLYENGLKNINGTFCKVTRLKIKELDDLYECRYYVEYGIHDEEGKETYEGQGKINILKRWLEDV